MSSWLESFEKIIRAYDVNPKIYTSEFRKLFAEPPIKNRLALVSAVYTQKLISELQTNSYDLPLQSYGNFSCQRCHNLLVIPKSGDYLIQQRRPDEGITLKLECPKCGRVYFF